jgi:hypothetical protein
VHLSLSGPVVIVALSMGQWRQACRPLSGSPATVFADVAKLFKQALRGKVGQSISIISAVNPSKPISKPGCRWPLFLLGALSGSVRYLTGLLLSGTLRERRHSRNVPRPVSSPVAFSHIPRAASLQQTVRFSSSTAFRPSGCVRPSLLPLLRFQKGRKNTGRNHKPKGREQ